MNFSRLHRPKTFNQIFGQDLAKAILKNSLFLDKIFSAYLFSGDRGCGKTTTGRIFAASLNCFELENFRKDPVGKDFPCLKCESCISMRNGTHPDFLELDAASNTGVENIRQIIETAHFQPVLSRRKVFLIDEAHMLSKAAFNALLKILEEAPATVVFILATTEISKIPLTIRSRSFLALFPSLSFEQTSAFLTQFCSEQNISADQEGLGLVANLSRGCLRDALNILQQSLFYNENLSKNSVQEVFGVPGEGVVIELIRCALDKDVLAVSEIFAKKTATLNPLELFNQIMEVLILLRYEKLGITYSAASFLAYSDQLKSLAKNHSEEFVNTLMQALWNNQKALYDVDAKMNFLQFVLTTFSKKNFELNESEKVQKKTKTIESKNPEIKKTVLESNSLPAKENPKTQEALVEKADSPAAQQVKNEFWKEQIAAGALGKDKLFHSAVLNLKKHEVVDGTLVLWFSKTNQFLINLMQENKSFLEGALAGQLFSKIEVKATEPVSAQQNQLTKQPGTPAAAQKKNSMTMTQAQGGPDFSDKEKWPGINSLLAEFSGKIKIEK